MAILRKGMIFISHAAYIEVLAFIVQLLASYIFVSVATGNAAKQSTLDTKVDLRTTKEDIMSELKDSRQSLLREQEAATKALKDVLTATIKAEIEQATKEMKK